MKKIFVVLAMMLAGAFVFGQSGVIREMTGTVELSEAGGGFVPAEIGSVLREDTVVSTGFRSSALIELGSAVLAVRPLTKLSLTEIRSSSGEELLGVNLQAGRVRVDVNPPAGTRASMSVSSPTATASVRGTSFEFDTRSLHVISGSVAFKGTRGPGAPVAAGSSGSVDRSGNALTPVSVGPVTAMRPQMPVGTQANSSPAPVAVSGGDAPSPAPPAPDPPSPTPPPPPTPTPPPMPTPIPPPGPAPTPAPTPTPNRPIPPSGGDNGGADINVGWN